MYAVTSVSVVDWNKGILSDFSSTISSGNQQEIVTNATNPDPGYTVVQDTLDGDTYAEEYSMEQPLLANSFGFHIVKGRLRWSVLFCHSCTKIHFLPIILENCSLLWKKMYFQKLCFF